MPKPILYLDIVGTLLVERGSRLQLAAYAKTFVHEAREHFELRFLTSLEEHNALAVARAVDTDIAYISFPRAIGKASAIDFKRIFWWVDDDPTPNDLLRLSDERCSDRLLMVNRRDGVTEATLRKLLDSWKRAGETERAADA